MSSAWGDAWGKAWGDAWGATTPDPAPEVKLAAPGGGLTRMRRKQDEELLELVVAMIVEEVI